jgi:hypothetical protein
MNISVEYSGSKITVSVNKEPYFLGVIKKKFWKDIWMLLDESKNEVASYTMDSKYFVYDFKMKVSIKNDSPSSTLILNYKNKKPHFLFEHSGSDYLIVFHSGNKISFFKDKQQFALMKKKSVSGWSGSEFLIRANDDINMTLFIILICSVLITRYNEPDGDSDFTIDLGSLVKELQPLDETWQPKVL